MLAAGSYLGDTGVFEENTGDLLYVLQGQKGGITQVRTCACMLLLKSKLLTRFWWQPISVLFFERCKRQNLL